MGDTDQASRRDDVPAALRLLPEIGAAILVVLVVAAAVSILAKWPYQFAGHGNPDTMLQDFLSSGTALAPPAYRSWCLPWRR